jgi:hypothetical protein
LYKRIKYLFLFSIIIGLIAYLFVGFQIGMSGKNFDSKNSILFKLYFDNLIVSELPVIGEANSIQYYRHESTPNFGAGWEVEYVTNIERKVVFRELSKYLNNYRIEIDTLKERGCNWNIIDKERLKNYDICKGFIDQQSFELRVSGYGSTCYVNFLVVD